MSGDTPEADDLLATEVNGQTRLSVVYSGQPGAADPRREIPVLGFREVLVSSHRS